MRVSYINFAVTYQCNSRCINCNIWQRRPKGELSLKEIRDKVVKSSLLQRLDSVGITGGEPFIRQDLHDICMTFYQQFPNLHIGIASHGMLGLRIAERALRIRDAAPQDRFSMSISIDGDERVHDHMRGIAGAFGKTLKTVRTLRAEGTPLCLSFTITLWNYRSLETVYQLARELGVGFIARFAQNSTYYGNETTDFRWTADSLGRARQALDRVIGHILATYDLTQKRLDPYIYFLTRAADHYEMQKRLTSCWSGSHSLFLDSLGNVYPCIMWASRMGSIQDNSLNEIFTSPAFEAARAAIAREECHCWTECESVKTLEKMDDILRWDPKATLSKYGLIVKEKYGMLHALKPENLPDQVAE